jgi:acyl-CoA thioesterase FadM
MEIDYLRPAPLYQPLVLIGRHLSHPRKADGTPSRKLFHQAEIQHPDGTVLARSKGLFIAIDEKTFANATLPTTQP